MALYIYTGVNRGSLQLRRYRSEHVEGFTGYGEWVIDGGRLLVKVGMLVRRSLSQPAEYYGEVGVETRRLTPIQLRRDVSESVAVTRSLIIRGDTARLLFERVRSFYEEKEKRGGG